ncbi:hypothetical protein A0H81_05554 [Grifola frondosa]|uniref:Uncharacterized protein n=1 Tax=Grifola frondosa TaxID=5627 RepID=A0A1C7MCQ3_GRIFR|nr:hypothetical protein A0H81_05554 [Grifola frondosa]
MGTSNLRAVQLFETHLSRFSFRVGRLSILASLISPEAHQSIISGASGPCVTLSCVHMYFCQLIIKDGIGFVATDVI